MELKQGKMRSRLCQPKPSRRLYAAGASLLLASSLAVPLVPAYAQQVGSPVGQMGQQNVAPLGQGSNNSVNRPSALTGQPQQARGAAERDGGQAGRPRADVPDLPSEVQRATPGGPVVGLPNISPQFPVPAGTDRSMTGGGVRITDILTNPRAWLGRAVIVNGEITDRLNPRAFVLNRDLLVLLPEPVSQLPRNTTAPQSAGVNLNVPGAAGGGASTVAGQLGVPGQIGEAGRQGQARPGAQQRSQAQLATGQLVQVAGVVRIFDPAALSRELNMDLSGRAFADFANSPVLIARALDASPTPVGAQPGLRQRGAPQVFNTEVSLLAAAPQNFQGDIVAIQGRIRQVIGPASGFWTLTLDDPSTLRRERIIVIADTAAAQRAAEEVILTQGDRIRVIGRVLLFDRALANELQNRLGIRLGEQEIQQLQGSAVVVANVLNTTVLPAMGQQPRAVQPSGRTASSITTGEIARNPSQVNQQRVSVEGRVTGILGQFAVVLDDRILVVADQPLSSMVDVPESRGAGTFRDQRSVTPLMEGDRIRVVGTVHPVDPQVFENQLGIMIRDWYYNVAPPTLPRRPDLDDWAGRPAIVASAITQVQPGFQSPTSAFRPETGSSTNLGSNIGMNQQNMSASGRDASQSIGGAGGAGEAGFTAPLSATPR